MQLPVYYRVLAIVFSIVGVAGLIEYASEGGSKSHSGHAPSGDAMRGIYPQRAETEYYLGRQVEAHVAEMDVQSALKDAQHLFLPFMEERDRRLQEAAGHYERAIAGGLKSNEDLYYNYALVLMRLGAAPVRIDEAVARWRKNFPNSQNVDLTERRAAIELQNRQLAALIATLLKEKEMQQRRQSLEELYSPKRAP